METNKLQQLMDTTLEALATADASEYFQKLFKTVTRQFIIYADEHGIDTFSMHQIAHCGAEPYHGTVGGRMAPALPFREYLSGKEKGL